MLPNSQTVIVGIEYTITLYQATMLHSLSFMLLEFYSHFNKSGAPLSQLVECQTLDRKVKGFF